MSGAARFGLAMALLGWLLIAMVVWRLWPAIGQFTDPVRTGNFYLPSESMLPTLQVNDRIRPRAADLVVLKPGAVIVFQGADSVRVARIAAIGGETVAIRAGRVIVDGDAAMLREAGAGPLVGGEGTRVQIERLPGEAGVHRLLNIGESPGDEFGPVHIPDGSLFVLGDNRDRAADSRFPLEQNGVGMVRVDQVIGVVDRVLWRSGFRNLGMPIDMQPAS